MPETKDQFKRLSVIIDCLNIAYKQDEHLTISNLLEAVNSKVKKTVSKSTIDKDLFFLRSEFKIRWVGSHKGIRLEKSIDFLMLVADWLQLRPEISTDEWLSVQPDYITILNSKQEYYGKTEFSYEAAATKYASEFHEWMKLKPTNK